MTPRPAADRIGVAEAKRHFADVLGAVRHRGRRYVIERRGTPMAALVPIEDLERLDAGPSEGGFLALVGTFQDAEDLAAILDDVVRRRADEDVRPVPEIGA